MLVTISGSWFVAVDPDIDDKVVVVIGIATFKKRIKSFYLVY